MTGKKAGTRRRSLTWCDASEITLSLRRLCLPCLDNIGGLCRERSIRHGTVTLFTALNYLEGRLVSSIEHQHRDQEGLAFLKRINRETPRPLQLHLIADNYATHKHPEVKAWLAKHKRFRMHFTPASSSWMNRGERFFRDITTYLREGSVSSVRELEALITAFLALRKAMPTRYVWNADGEQILAKIKTVT